MLTDERAEDLLHAAVTAVRAGDGFEALLNELPVPVYMTDAEGLVTFWNHACIHFAGREPQLGSDRWCVTWELYTIEGDRLPHDKCPMAKAIKEKRSIRGEVAIAMRPDGSRVAFTPYPTPIFDPQGRLAGAINLLIDTSDEQASSLDYQADRCRRLARATHDLSAAEVLERMASSYDETAAALRSDH